MTENTQEQKSYSAFISHAKENLQAAEEIVRSLESKGLTCWIAPRDVPPGANWIEEILRGIEQSKCFVLVLSDEANRSGHVLREVERAASKAKPIYPVRLEDIPLSPKLEYLISMHQWLDAWEGYFDAHMQRLASAIESDEEWIGNVVLQRRRRRHISSGIAAVVVVIVLALVTIFDREIRQLFLTPEKIAEETLEKRNISVNIEGLAQAIASANQDQLELFSQTGVSDEELTTAFSRENVAFEFFKNSKGQKRALVWFASAVNSSLNPNMTVPRPYYEEQGILASALQAGNLEASKILLDAGASPHIYQTLWLTEYSLPLFLFPYSYLEKFSGFTSEEKETLAKAFIDAGAVVSLPVGDNANHRSWAGQLAQVKRDQDEIRARYGLTIPVATSICETNEERTLCRAASKYTGFNWCEFAETLPKSIRSRKTDFIEFTNVELVRLINIVNDKAYVLANIFSGYRPGYGLVEISKDKRSWYIYKYIDPATGMGHCKKDSNGNTPKNCWRRVLLVEGGDNNSLMLENFYTYQKLSCEQQNTVTDDVEKLEKSSIAGVPLNPYLLTLLAVADIPETLDQETLLSLTEMEVKQAQASQGSQSPDTETPMPFASQRVMNRDPQFVAHELASEFGDYLRKLAEGATRDVWVEYPLRVVGYDHENHQLRLEKQWIGGGAANREPELLPVYIKKDFESHIPVEARNLHLYELEPTMPSQDTGPFISIKNDRNVLIRNGILALDRILRLEGIRMDPTEAERLAQEIGGLEYASSSLRTRVALTIERIAGKNEPRHLPLVFAKVGRVEILKPDDSVIASFEPNAFTSAIEANKPEAAKLKVLPPEDGRIPLDGETLDILVVKHFPAHFDEAMTYRMMRARWEYEQTAENPRQGKFFKGAREPAQEDLERLKPQFREWIFTRANHIGNTFLLREKCGLRSTGFSPTGMGCLRILRRWSPHLDGYISREEFQQRTQVSSTGPGPEYGWWYSLHYDREPPSRLQAPYYVRDLPQDTLDIIHISGGIPLPAEDVLPLCDKNIDSCPSYGAEFELDLSQLVFNKGKAEVKKSGRSEQVAYILKVKVTRARFYELQSDKVLSWKFGKLLAEADPGQLHNPPSAPVQEKETEPDRAVEVPPLSDGPYGPDVVGLKLGMKFEEAEEIIRQHMAVCKVLKIERSMQHMLGSLKPYSSGRLFIDEDEKEFIAIFDEPPSAPGIIVGLWRRLYVGKEEITSATLLEKLLDKYGTPDVRTGGNQSFRVSWGKDGKGYDDVICGSMIRDTVAAQSTWLEENGQPIDWKMQGKKGYNLMLPQLMFHNAIDNPKLERHYSNCVPVLEVRYVLSSKHHISTTSLVDHKRYSSLFAKSMRMASE